MATIDDLPSGTLLYEESSVRSVSEAIRAITGKDTKYSHVDQPNVIRNIKRYIYPFFMLGPGSGGIGCIGGSGWWGNSAGGYKPGPIFPNILYNFRESQKNLNIVFKISPTETDFDARVKVGGYEIFAEYQSNVPRIRVNGVGSYDYSPNDECKIVIDTHQYQTGGKLYLYINDVLKVDGVAISDSEFTEHNEEGRDYFDLQFPSYSANPGTTSTHWHTCEIKYLRLEMEDWV